jgi:hypothetical protein
MTRPDPVRPRSEPGCPQPGTSGATRALLWKEWREQRWRGVLAVLVLTTLAASLIRAQLVMLPEALLLIFGPVGLLLAVLLAMGSVATERQDGTWPFLRARPVGPAHLLRAKWFIGAAQLAAALLLAGVAAHLAAASRGLFDLPAPPAEVAASFPRTPIIQNDSPAALWGIVGLALTGLIAWYTVLFLILTRARNELHAGIGGLLLTIVVLAWLVQYPLSSSVEVSDPATRKVLWTSALLNPLCPLAFTFEPWPRLLLAPLVSLLWIAVPLWLIGRLERRGTLR